MVNWDDFCLGGSDCYCTTKFPDLASGEGACVWTWAIFLSLLMLCIGIPICFVCDLNSPFCCMQYTGTCVPCNDRDYSHTGERRKLVDP
jgi:hypothetical protein